MQRIPAKKVINPSVQYDGPLIQALEKTIISTAAKKLEILSYFFERTKYAKNAVAV